jgi:predicted homoserine dehydrogenase-like protein
MAAAKGWEKGTKQAVSGRQPRIKEEREGIKEGPAGSALLIPPTHLAQLERDLHSHSFVLRHPWAFESFEMNPAYCLACGLTNDGWKISVTNCLLI